MAYQILKSSTECPLLFFMVESADHLTALTGASPTVTISKNGSTFGSPSGAVSEIANGWYKVAGNATDTGTAGPIALHATATSGDPFDGIVAEVVAYDPQDSVRGGMTALPNAAAGASGGLPLSVDTSGRVDVLKVNGTSQTARDLGASVLLSAGTGTGQLDFTSGVVKANLAQILGTALTETSGYLAAAFKAFFNIGSPVLTTASVNQTGDAYNVIKSGGAGDAAAIKTQTDKLAFTVTNKVDANVYDWNGTAVHSPGTAGIPDVNLINIANAAVSTASAQLGVNAVQIGGSVPGSATIGTVTTLTNMPLVAIKKNTALAKFAFLMTDSTNHAPATGQTVTCTRSIDGGAFGAGTLANVAELSNGVYLVDFLAADLNGGVITLQATASGCDTTFVTLVTAQ